MSKTPMPKDTPPSPTPKATLAYAFYAAAIWALVAYSVWGPKAQDSFALASAAICPR